MSSFLQTLLLLRFFTKTFFYLLCSLLKRSTRFLCRMELVCLYQQLAFSAGKIALWCVFTGICPVKQLVFLNIFGSFVLIHLWWDNVILNSYLTQNQGGYSLCLIRKSKVFLGFFHQDLNVFILLCK